MAFITTMISPLLHWSKSLPIPPIIPRPRKTITPTLNPVGLLSLRSQCTTDPCHLHIPIRRPHIPRSTCRNGRVRSPVHPKTAALLRWYSFSTGPFCHFQRLFQPCQSLLLYLPKRSPCCPRHEEHSQIATGARCASTTMRIRM